VRVGRLVDLCVCNTRNPGQGQTTASLLKFLMKICPAQPDKCQIV
jgi:hypothetical protein